MSRSLQAAAVALILGGAAAVAPAESIRFQEVARDAGLTFEHFNGSAGHYYLVEVMGSGAALFDYDGDGDLDAYLVQGGMPDPDQSLDDALAPPATGSPPLIDRLFRNDSHRGADGSPRLTFVDVTARSAIEAPHYGMGAAVGDFDGDGWVDMYVTNFGPNQLLRNRGDGTFEDVTDEAGAGDHRWSVPAVFTDFDGDGALDLYVGNYLDHRFTAGSSCTTSTGAPDYCGPLAFRPLPDRLLRNRGDGTFTDQSAAGGAEEAFGGALGVVATDFDGDGRIDFYVANDMTPNQLRINRGDGSFVDDAAFAGAAVNWEGKPEASMGVDASDFDGDGDDDLFISHLTGETNTLYVNDGSGIFDDVTVTSGLGNASWVSTGFGTGWIDVDADGRLDLFIANGAVRVIEELAQAGDPNPLHQRNQLFRNVGGGRFEETEAGPLTELSEVSRGAAFGDIDNDGDADILVSNNGGPARLFLNGSDPGPWIGLAPGRTGESGWRARFEIAEGPAVWRRSRTDGSYASARDPRVLVAGAAGAADAVTVVAGDGRRRRWQSPVAGRYAVWPAGASGASLP